MLEALLEPITSSDPIDPASAERLDDEDRMTIEKCDQCLLSDANA